MTGQEAAPQPLVASKALRHATALVLHGIGIMIEGPSGAGKSRLAFALLQGEGCQPSLGAGQPTDHHTALIGDDYVALTPGSSGHHLIASPAPNLAGLIEVRGIGIVGLAWRKAAPLHLSVVLAPVDTIERLPEPATAQVDGYPLANVHVPIGDLAHQMMLVRTAAALVAR